MRRFTLLILATFIFGIMMSQTVIYQDNFDSYNLTQGIAAQSTHWRTWSSQNGGGSDDAMMSTAKSVSGTKSLKIINNDDIVYNFGGLTSGHYQISFNFLINTSYGAYFNLEHVFTSNYAFDMYFKTNGSVIFDNNTDSLTIFSYTHNQWNSLTLDIDLDNDSVKILLNNVLKGTYQYSKSTNSTATNTLGCIDFYGINTAMIANSSWHIDDFKFQNMSSPNFPFVEQTGISLAGASYNSNVAWGDYDNDGDLDILLTGNLFSKIYKNNNNTFTEQTGISLTGIKSGSSEWGDYDNDGYLDILITGEDASGNKIAKIYKNNGLNNFVLQSGISLTGVYDGAVAWGDYDNDGDLDILMTGSTASNTRISKVYKNMAPISSSFIEQTSIVLDTVNHSSVNWADYDNDGDLDILITGHGGNVLIASLYKNNGDNSFTKQTNTGIDPIAYGSVDWGDYDNDGDLDLIMMGSKYNNGWYQETFIYKNNSNNTFTKQTGISLTGAYSGSAVWGDYNNDGNIDILLAGASSAGRITKIYQSNGNNSFTELAGNTLDSVGWGDADWGDYDNDGDLDILLNGSATAGNITKIYKNIGTTFNTSPTTPTNLNTVFQGDSIAILSWNKSTDTQTPQNGLSYNIRIGTASNGNQITSAQSNVSTGYRRLVEIGNAQKTNSYTLKLDPMAQCSNLYWSVQAIDNAFAGSAFSTEQLAKGSDTSSIIVATCGTYISPSGKSFTNSGTYLDTIPTAAGCDSIITINLTINPPYINTQSNSICDSDSILWRGSYYSAPGLFNDTLTTTGGCDSILQLDLTVNSSYIIIEINTACNGDSLLWHNSYYSTTGIYYDSLNTINGCDSIYELNLNITPVYSFTEYDTICYGDTLNWHGKTLFAAGIHYDSLNTSYGCDSVFALNLYLKTLPTAAITANGATTFCNGLNVLLQANSGTFSYSWKKDGLGLSAHQPTYLAGLGGNYTVIVTDTSDLYACSNTSSPVTVTVNSNNYNISFTANPTIFTSVPYFTVFYNQTVNASNYSWKWLFGDGTISTQQAPSHTYTSYGTYSVSAIATNASTGCTDTMTYPNFITCSGTNPCNVIAGIFPVGPKTICANDSFELRATGNAPTYTYQWMYNGVQISGAIDSVYWAKNVGTYKLKVTDSCSNYSADFVLYKYPDNTPIIFANGIIQPCSNDSMELYTPVSYNSYLWSTGATSQNVFIKTSGQYSLQITDGNSCTYNSLPYVVNTSLLTTPEICIIGVDSATGFNRVIYERQTSSLIDSFNIYRETNVSNIYQKIGALDFNSSGIFIDQNSNPAQQAYRYKISATDTCGNETPLSNYHKTIHLTINAGLNNTWNLIWDSYEGFTFGSYRIYRGADSLNMQFLTQIQSTLTSFTDLNPPAGNIFYQIEVMSPSPCFPDSIFAKANTNYNYSRSNTANSSTAHNTGIIVNSGIPMHIKVFPNPNKGEFTLEINNNNSINLNLHIYNALGSEIYTENIKTQGISKKRINLKHLPKGVYYLILNNNEALVYRAKVIIQ